MGETETALPRLVGEAAEWAGEIYRTLHRYPETANEEYRTAALIERYLTELGLESRRPLPTSVIAGQRAHAVKRVVLRAETDALRIREETGLPYASCRDGYMHACGHDVHMAVVLGTARVLGKIKESVDIDIKYIFQQDEEDSGKGRELTEAGEVRQGDVILGLHVRPSLPAGTVGVKSGLLHGASTMFDLTVRGRGCHGAMPHLGRDAIAAAAAIVSASLALTHRALDPVRASVVSFGSISGGKSRNTIADEVTLSGIVRGEDRAACAALSGGLARIAGEIAGAYGCRAEIQLQEGYPPLVNDPAMAAAVCEAAARYNAAAGHAAIEIRKTEGFSLTVDDFAYYLEKARGAYFFLGSGFPGRENSELHTGIFRADERCIETGIAALTASVLLLADSPLLPAREVDSLLRSAGGADPFSQTADRTD